MFKLKKKDNKKEVIKQIYSVLKDCEESQGFCLFTTYLFKEGNENRLRHNMFSVSFNSNDLPATLEEYRNLSQMHLNKMRIEEIQGKIPGAIEAPVKEKVVEFIPKE